MIKIILIAGCLLLSGASATASDIPSLSWWGWQKDFDADSYAAVKVFWRGKSLGNIDEADKKLSKIILKEGDTVFVEMPASINLSTEHSAPYATSRFMYAWYDKKVKLRYFQLGKQYPVHTLALSNWEITPGGGVSNFKKTHLIFDHVDLGLLSTAVERLKGYPWEHGAVVQYFENNRRSPDVADNVGPEALFSFMDWIKDNHKAVVEDLYPGG